MPCDRLDQLRLHVRNLQSQLKDKIRKSQDWPTEGHENASTGKTDYEPFLRHRLNLIKAEIVKHLEEHNCER